MASIELRKLTKQFKNVTAVHEISLSIDDKEFITLLGPSGCGKTTTLNMIAGLEAPTRGEIYLDGMLINRVPPARRDIAMVFQNYALYPHMTVRANMGFALKVRRLEREAINAKVQEAARVLDIASLLDRYPRQLSGGQRQRVALGRALVREPKVFLLDEPLSNLDATLRVQMRAEMKMIFNHLQATVVYVTHDQAEAMTMSDRIAIFREGVVQQVDTPVNVYSRPVNRFVASFVGSPAINQVAGRLEASDGQLRACTADFQLDLSPLATKLRLSSFHDREVVVAIRPEDLRPVNSESLGQICGTICGHIEVIEQLGSATILYVNSGSGLLVGQIASTLQARAGDRMQLAWPLDRLYLFDQETGKTLLSPGLLAAL